MSAPDPFDFIDEDGDRLTAADDRESLLVSIETKGGDFAQCRLDVEARIRLAAAALRTSRSFAASIMDGTLG